MGIIAAAGFSAHIIIYQQVGVHLFYLPIHPSISTFGEDEEGEIYLADYAGKIYKIEYEEPVFTITGNAGISAVELSYTDGTAKTALSKTDGGYSLKVPPNWERERNAHTSVLHFHPRQPYL